MIGILAGTATLSIAVQCVGLFPALHRMGFRFRWLWGVRGHGFGEISSIAKWTVGSIVVQQLGFIVTSRVLTRASALASRSGESVPGLFAFTNAQFIVLLPHGLVTVSLVTALYTRLSEAASEGDDAAVVRYHHQGMRMPSVLLVPGVALALAFAPLVASTIFFGNTLAQTAAVTTVLYGVLWLVIPMGWGFLNDRVLYAQTQTYLTFRIQAVVTSTATLVTLLAATVDPGRTAFVVGLGQATAYLVGSTIGFAVLRRQHGPLGLRSTGLIYLKLAVPSAASALLLALAVRGLLPDVAQIRGVPGLLAGGAVLAAAGVVHLLVVWGVAHLLGVTEVGRLLDPVTRRVRGLRRG